MLSQITAFADFPEAVLTGLVDTARDHGARLTVENCPMIFSYDEWPGGDNIFQR